MWKEENLEEDLQKIKNNSFDDLSVFKKSPPKDMYLLYRYNYFQLISYIKQNKVDSLKKQGVASAGLILSFLLQYNYAENLVKESNEPPFDYCVLTFFHPKIGTPNSSFFITYLDHYLKISRQLSEIFENQEIYLCDQINKSDFLIKRDSALDILHKRIDFIIEIILGILLESNKPNLINSFMNNYKPWELATSEETNSYIGRVALAVGNQANAERSFSNVKTDERQNANKGFEELFRGRFGASLEHFSKSGAAVPEDLDPVRRYNGEKLEEHISRSKNIFINKR